MSHPSTSSAFWMGFRDGLPFLLVVAPFGLLFGVVATEAGLNLAEVMGFTVLVIAGASQFAAIHLMAENAPTIVVLVTALAVNLRMAMYSAAITPHLGAASFRLRAIAAYFLVDQTYALADAKYARHPDWPLRSKFAYFFGTVAPICPVWYAVTLAGALVGNRIPPEYALDFAVPITFLALVAPALRSAAHLIAAAVSIALGLTFAFMPYNAGLLLAALGAMMAGAQAELFFARRAERRAE